MKPEASGDSRQLASQAAEKALAAIARLQEESAQLYREFLEAQAEAKAALGDLRRSQEPAIGQEGPPEVPPPPDLDVSPRKLNSAKSVTSPPIAMGGWRETSVPREPVFDPAFSGTPSHLRGEPPTPPPAPAAGEETRVGGAESDDQLEHDLRNFIADQTGYPAEMIGLDFDLETDLGIDSAKREEILRLIQKAHPQMEHVVYNELEKQRSLRELIVYFKSTAAPSNVVSLPGARRPEFIPSAQRINLHPESENSLPPTPVEHTQLIPSVLAAESSTSPALALRHNPVLEFPVNPLFRSQQAELTELRFNTRDHSWLESYRLGSLGSLPFAIMIEILASDVSGADPWVLRNVVCHRQAEVDASGNLNVRLHREQHGDQLSVRLLDDSSNAVLAEASLSSQLSAEQLPSALGASELKSYTRTMTDLYQGTLFHGRHFQTIKSIRGLGKAGGQAVVQASAQAQEWLGNNYGPEWAFQPQVTESIFQLAAIWSVTQYGIPSLPRRIDSFERLSPLPLSELMIDLIVEDVDEREFKTGVLLADRQKRPLACLRGVHFAMDPNLKEVFCRLKLPASIRLPSMPPPR